MRLLYFINDQNGSKFGTHDTNDTKIMNNFFSQCTLYIVRIIDSACLWVEILTFVYISLRTLVIYIHPKMGALILYFIHTDLHTFLLLMHIYIHTVDSLVY